MIKLFLLFFSVSTIIAFAETVSIANITPEQTTIERNQVIWMYTMKVRYWSDGTKITIFNMLPDSKIHKEFVRNVLKMSTISYQQAIDRLINAGYSSFFKTVKNENEMFNRVNIINGAIGYVSENKILVCDNGILHILNIVD